jgi:lysophospholipase L1-like esterase
MKFLRVALVLSAVLGALAPVRSTPVQVEKFTGPITVAVVGDSITQGFYADPGYSYALQLSRLLGDKWNLQIYGLGGTTMQKKSDNPYWNHPEYKTALALQPDVVIIELGTNDTKPYNWHADAFVTDYQDMIKSFQALPKKPHIYLCLPPPVTPPGGYAIPVEGPGEVIPLIRKLADQYQCDLIDFNTSLQSHPDLLPDHVHPGAQGGFFLAKIAYTALTGKEYTGQIIPPPPAH